MKTDAADALPEPEESGAFRPAPNARSPRRCQVEPLLGANLRKFMQTHQLDRLRPEGTLHLTKVIARVSLGIVWLYEGLVPKILFLRANPEQTDLVARSGLYWPTPEATLVILGVAQVLTGLILIAGWAERAAVAVATLSMGVLIVLVASGKPAMLIDPFGALAKDFCLIACALTVWLLAPVCPRCQTRDPGGAT